MKKLITLLMASSANFVLAQSTTNLISNPGFEEKLNNWSFSSKNSQAITGGLSGVYSARIGTSNGSITQDVTSRLEIGRKYTLSSKAKISKSSTSANIAISFYDSLGKIIQVNKVALAYTSYQYYSTNFTVPFGTAKIIVSANKVSGSFAYAFFDDFELVDITPNSTPTPTPTPSPLPSPISYYQPMGIGGGGAMRDTLDLSNFSMVFFTFKR